MERELPPTELRHLESMIASMRVNELQSVLSLFKMPKLGKKQDLIHRCTELLRTPSIQTQVAAQVKAIVGKTRSAPYTVPPPVRGAYVSNSLLNGITGAYGGGYRGQIYQIPSNALPTSRPLRHLVLMDLPFYDCHQTLLEPMELPAVMSGVKTPCKQSFAFIVPRESFKCWTQSTPLPRFEIQLRFFNVPTGYTNEELPDDFPLNCVARVEEQVVQLPPVIPTNKPNVEPKRPSRPVDITQHCMNARDLSRAVRLSVEWTGDKRVWAVAVFLVYRVTAEMLRDRAIGTAEQYTGGKREPVNHHQEEHVTRDMIRARLGHGNDDDIAMAQLKISLICPLSRTRIVLPARCKKCSHLQCFDLYVYLQMEEKRPTWRCPVCSDWAPYKFLIIDAYFQNILKNVSRDVVEVELLVDGSYKTLQTECVDVDSDGASSDDMKPGVSTKNATKDGIPHTNSSKAVTPSDVDVIVISDSDDDEEVAQAIQASIVDSTNSNSIGSAASPSQSRDDSVIILDDDSPPRLQPLPAPSKTSSSSPSSLPSVSSSPATVSAFTTAAAVTTTTSAQSSSIGIHTPVPSRLSTIPPLIGSSPQSLFNNNNPLSYYHQSQWSQPAASRPQFTLPQQNHQPHNASSIGTLNGSGKYSMPPYNQHQFGNLFGRYQPNNMSSVPITFNYAAAAAAAGMQSTTPSFSSTPNLQQVLASLAQQSTHTNATSSNNISSS